MIATDSRAGVWIPTKSQQSPDLWQGQELRHLPLLSWKAQRGYLFFSLQAPNTWPSDMWDSHVGSRGMKQSSSAIKRSQLCLPNLALGGLLRGSTHSPSGPPLKARLRGSAFQTAEGSESRSNNVICQVLQLPGLVLPTASCCLDSHWAFPYKMWRSHWWLCCAFPTIPSYYFQCN